MAKAVKSMSAPYVVPSSLKREHKFTMLLTKEERARLQALADERGLTASDVVRQYIRESTRDYRAA
jgi:hypothetical protein